MRTKKHLGQHFLRAPHLIEKILDALEPSGQDIFLEIGPGPGTLTLPLNRRGFGLTAIETDPDMIGYLRSQHFDPDIDLIEADFLKLDPSTVIRPGTKVLSNLPYNVSVPITASLLPYCPDIPIMVLMYQKEVAERIRAVPRTKDYGPISVLVQVLYAIDWKMNVAPGNFRPPPKVMSQVIRLRRLDEPLIDLTDLPKLEELTRYLFNRRRKMIGGQLKKARFHWTTPEHLLESLNQCGFLPTQRPEELSPNDYAAWMISLKKERP